MKRGRGPIVDELLHSIEALDGITEVKCHQFGRDFCCAAKIEVGTNFINTSAYGANRLHALARLLIRITQLRSGG